MANNVISFNDAVLELQKLNKVAANQEKYAKADATMQKVMVGLDAMGNKELQREEEILRKEEKHQELDIILKKIFPKAFKSKGE